MNTSIDVEETTDYCHNYVVAVTERKIGIYVGV